MSNKPTYLEAGETWHCNRVVFNEHGEATTALKAKHIHGVEPVVIFERDDGWRLGAPAHLEAVARQLWEDTWVSVARWDGERWQGWETLCDYGDPLTGPHD